MGLENGARLEVETMIRTAQEGCPVGNENKIEIKHLQRSIEAMQEVDNKIFDKLDNQQKDISAQNERQSKKIDDVVRMMLANLFTVVGSIIVGIVIFLFKSAHP